MGSGSSASARVLSRRPAHARAGASARRIVASRTRGSGSARPSSIEPASRDDSNSSVQSACSRPRAFGRLPDHGAQQRGDRAILSFEQQPLSRLAPPCVRIGQKLHELCRRSITRPRAAAAGRLTHRMNQRIEAAAISPAGEVKVLLDRLGYRDGMLDRLAIHVEDEQRSIRRIRKIHGTKPVVGRGQELGFLDRPDGPGRWLRRFRGSCGEPDYPRHHRQTHCRDIPADKPSRGKW